MGNHTEPRTWNDDLGGLRQESYTKGENWGFQLNFMVPLDRQSLKQCKAMAKRQEEKMRLDYELVRALKCAELQQKGFMILPKTRVYHMCSDIIPISSWTKAVNKVLSCTTPPKPWYKPWKNPKQQCTMSTLSDQKAKELAASSKPKEEEKKEDSK